MRQVEFESKYVVKSDLEVSNFEKTFFQKLSECLFNLLSASNLECLSLPLAACNLGMP